MKIIQGFLISGFVACLVSCHSAKYISHPVVSAAKVLPVLPQSQINIPVKVYLRPLLSRMDSSTSREFTSANWPGFFQSSCDFRYKYRFIRSPFVFSCINNRVNIGFKGYYQIAGSKTVCAFDKQVSPWVSGSCGFGNEPLRRVDINIQSLLELLPDHQLRTTTRLDKLNAAEKCEVSVLKTDVTNEVMDSIRSSVDNYCLAFDRFVQTLNNNEILTQWRKGGSRVMPISQYGFLNLNPSGLRVGKFNYTRDTLFFSVGFSGSPQFSSDSLSLISRMDMPSISNIENNSGISTYLNATYEYQFLSRLLNDSLRNKPFLADGRTFIIKDISVGGTDDGKVWVDMSFTGNRSGVLHISGTPRLDTATQVLSMPDISFSVNTKDILVNIAKGLFRKKIMRKLKDQSVLDIAALIQRNRRAIETRLNQPVNEWMSTTGNLSQLKLIGLLPQKNFIQIQVYIQADIFLIGHPPAEKLLYSRSSF